MLKKIFVFIVTMLILCQVSYAFALELEYDGAKHIYSGPEVNLILNNEKFEVIEGLMPPVIIENRTLVPVREVFEKLNGTVTWNGDEKSILIEFGSKKIMLWLDETQAKVNEEIVTLDVPAKLINGKTMVPARFISENGGLEVMWDGETSTVSISKPLNLEQNKITSIVHDFVDKTECVIITTENAIEKYKYFTLTEPDRIIVDVYDSKFTIDTKPVEIHSEDIEQLRFGIQEENVNRLVIDLNHAIEYTVVQSTDKTKIYIATEPNFVLEQDPIESNPTEEKPVEQDPEENPTDVPDTVPSEEIPSIPVEPSDENPSEENPIEEKPNEEEPIEEKFISVTSVKYNTTNDRVRIIMDDNPEYEAFELAEPNRIVMDIKGAKLNTTDLNVITLKNEIINTIRFAQNDENTVRVVLELNEKATYSVIKKSKELQIDVEALPYKNVEYISEGDTSKIILKGVSKDVLTLRKGTSNSYTISFFSSKFKTGKGTIEPADTDKLLSKVTITKTKITIKGKTAVTYSAKQVGEDVVITVNKKDDSKIKTIVIDVGHGGNDPGACNGTAYEKVYNLKIALKLYEKLSEEPNIEVVIDRKDDTYLSREDRVEFINDQEDADLLISVHNNSLANKAYSGTMVLFYNKDSDEQFGITSKQYAQNVLSELIENLGTINRGTVSRDDLHVLTKTNIPSILCEVCFISNDEELERLKTDDFQELVADAMYNGIMETIDMMD